MNLLQAGLLNKQKVQCQCPVQIACRASSVHTSCMWGEPHFPQCLGCPGFLHQSASDPHQFKSLCEVRALIGHTQPCCFHGPLEDRHRSVHNRKKALPLNMGVYNDWTQIFEQVETFNIHSSWNIVQFNILSCFSLKQTEISVRSSVISIYQNPNSPVKRSSKYIQYQCGISHFDTHHNEVVSFHFSHIKGLEKPLQS